MDVGWVECSETQHPKPCGCHNALGFTRFWVISGVSVPLKPLCWMRFFSSSPFNPTYGTVSETEVHTLILEPAAVVFLFVS